MENTSAELPDALTGEMLLLYVVNGFTLFDRQDTTGLAFREYISQFCFFLGFMRNSPLILIGIDECIERGYIWLTPKHTLGVTEVGMAFCNTFRHCHGAGFWVGTYYHRQQLLDTLRQHQRRMFGAAINSLD